MIKLGHFLEYEKAHWQGWIISFGLFYSFWSTWTQMACYQAHVVDTGLLEKIWAFCHCCISWILSGHNATGQLQRQRAFCLPLLNWLGWSPTTPCQR